RKENLDISTKLYLIFCFTENNGTSIFSRPGCFAARAMGADLAYMGTRFIPSAESFASDEYKEMLIESNLDDLIYTDAFSGVHANFLKPSIRRAGLDPDRLQKKENVDFSHLSQTDAKAWKDIWSAGQGVGRIERVQTASEI